MVFSKENFISSIAEVCIFTIGIMSGIPTR